MLSRFHPIPKRWTDRQTDGQTGRIAISISRVTVSVLTRDKNKTVGIDGRLLWDHEVLARWQHPARGAG